MVNSVVAKGVETSLWLLTFQSYRSFYMSFCFDLDEVGDVVCDDVTAIDILVAVAGGVANDYYNITAVGKSSSTLLLLCLSKLLLLKTICCG